MESFKEHIINKGGTTVLRPFGEGPYFFIKGEKNEKRIRKNL